MLGSMRSILSRRARNCSTAPAILRADLRLAVRLIDALLVKANIRDWPLDVSDEVPGGRGKWRGRRAALFISVPAADTCRMPLEGAISLLGSHGETTAF
jgi:hypothetical protein